MSLSIGIIGLPNVGKSTLFNALVKGYQAKTAPHPFTTIDPNVGIVEVHDDRLQLTADRLRLAKQIPTTIKFIDIAGLVSGAHKGEGLGNQFLSHIRECDAILHLINGFGENIDIESDIETVQTELILKDLETIRRAQGEKNLVSKRPHFAEASRGRKEILIKLSEAINQDKPAREVKLKKEEFDEIKDLNLLTQKPILYVLNILEEQIGKPQSDNKLLPICAKLESDLISLSKEEQTEYLKAIGETQSGLVKIINAAYKLLGLITFYTLLPNQVQAWSIQNGATAKEAAGKIHTDFEKKFIMAEVISFQNLIKYSSWQETHQKGKIQTEGKDYIVQNGDVIYFKHG